MSLFGALFSGVSGLAAQSSAMGAIADNVTNVNTIGYKATRVNFKTLITSQVSLTQYSPGGVQSSPRQGIDLQGLLQATSSSTDVGISGQGFFIANEAAQPGVGDQFVYTRAGSFKVDRQGFLQNVGSAYMQGWPLSAGITAAGASNVQVGNDVFTKTYINGNGDRVLINDNIIDSTNLQPLNLQTIGGTASPTHNISIGANLPSDDIVGTTHRTNAQIFDTLGNPHNLTYAFTKRSSNAWSIQPEPPAQSATVTMKTQNGEVYASSGRIDFLDQFTAPITGTINITAVGVPLQLTITANADDLDPTDGFYNIDTTGRTLSQIIDQVGIGINDFLSQASVFGPPPSSTGGWARRVTGENGVTFDNVDATGMTFDANVNDATGPPGAQLVFQSATGGYTVAGLDTTYGWWDNTTTPGAGTFLKDAINFTGEGTPNFLFGRDATTANSPRGTLEIDWENGATDMTPTNTLTSPPISVFLGNFNTPDGLTQLAGSYQLNFLQQDGAKFGNFAGVSIGQDGIVTALFDNGVTRPVFMIPLATFTNPNGLSSLSGNTWIATDFSGNPTLREAGDAGAGHINAASLESSTVDLGEEFTRMITTQRAYSSAAKVITTSDQMLDELLSIKR